MSDDTQLPDGTAPKPVRSTSRARRIGGTGKSSSPSPAPSPTPSPAAGTAPESEAPQTVAGQTSVRLDKRPAATAKGAKAPETDGDDTGDADAETDVDLVVDDEPRPGAPMWLPALVALAGTAAAIVFLVLGVIASSGVWWGKTDGVRVQRGAVLAAAKSCMATMNTYDYRKLDQAEQAGLACTTGKLTSQYRTAIEKVIKPQASKVQFTQTAQILNAGVEGVSADGSQWTVLVFGQLSTTNSATGTKTPRLDLFSARAVLQQAGGKWRIANYEYAPSS
jgi:hypothetical protein